MTRTYLVRALFAGSAMMLSAAALAQPVEPQPDPSDVTADAAITAAAGVDDAQAKIELLQAQVEALQESIAQMQASLVKVTPSWKGAPEYSDKKAGFSFKPKGILQFDAGYVGFPDGEERSGTFGGLNYNNLGWNTRARRLVFGAEGGLPGGFKYKAEFNFAQGAVDYEDVILSYDFKKSPLTITVGNFFPYSSLETVTSSRFGSMLERASFTDAFNYNRRVGVALSLADKKADRYTLSAGLFSEPMNNGNSDRTGWEASARGTFTPQLAGGLLHLGASVHHRVNPQDEQGATYRSRPLTQITGESFVNASGIASKGDDSVGIELGGVFKSLHFAAEAQKLWVRGTYQPGESVDGDNNAITGTRYNDDPSFFGGYFELGYYLTGESRGYKGGKWDRTKVRKPFDQGGWGAIQLNARIDYLDLTDRVDDSAVVTAPTYVNGGTQLGYQLSLIWNPIDYLRFMAQYGHASIHGGPRAAVVDPANPDPRRNYGVDTAAVRAQIDF